MLNPADLDLTSLPQLPKQMKHRIKEVAAFNGITTAYRLSLETGIGRTTCYAFFNNPKLIPRSSTILTLCRCFGCSADDLMIYDDTSNIDPLAIEVKHLQALDTLQQLADEQSVSLQSVINHILLIHNREGEGE